MGVGAATVMIRALIMRARCSGTVALMCRKPAVLICASIAAVSMLLLPVESHSISGAGQEWRRIDFGGLGLGRVWELWRSSSERTREIAGRTVDIDIKGKGVAGAIGVALVLSACTWIVYSAMAGRLARSGVCAKCGYNINKLSGRTCPECGSETMIRKRGAS